MGECSAEATLREGENWYVAGFVPVEAVKVNKIELGDSGYAKKRLGVVKSAWVEYDAFLKPSVAPIWAGLGCQFPGQGMEGRG